MTEEEILAMKPGRELNIKVAEDVMGHEVTVDEIFGDVERHIDKEGRSVYGPLMPYSEDISAAQVVRDKMIDLGHGDAIFWEGYGNGLYMQAEAICKVALLVVLEIEKEKEGIPPQMKKFLGEVGDGLNQN